MTSSGAPTTGITIYFAFAREDEAIQKKLEKQFSSLKRSHGITCWHRYMVSGGEEVRREVEEHLQCASVILLLISPDYLNSGKWYELEIEKAMQRSEAGSAHVVPIIIRPTYGWQEAPFDKLQPLPKNVEQSDAGIRYERDYKKIAEDIGTIVKSLQPGASRYRQISPFMARSFPPAFSPFVQKRSKVVQQVYRRLTQPDTSALALTGIGGAGKSTLANLVYHHAQKQLAAGEGPFTAAPVWLEINPSFTMNDLMAGIFNALEIPRAGKEMLLPQEQAMILFNTLNSTQARLIVLDQFEHFIDARTREVSPEYPGVQEWLSLLNRNTCACRILLTSRLNLDVLDASHVQNFS
ncbi:MAG TPA: TIR domain-containing protein, partial [Ktedonobacteraceae bacterium]|nr:TIR domain-containing protein [Ktedonobacteraceae bacterium]